MIQEQTHYEALDVAEDASEKTIKAAFYKKVRQHPPEQDPEAYKAIREAYDVLSNPVSRKEYDNMASYGEEIEQLEEEATAFLQEEPPDPGAAITKLKRAVLLGPDIGLLRNLLGQAFLMNEESENALAQFEKALEIDDSNPAYRLNKGHAQKEAGKLHAAEQTFRSVWDRDQGDYASARALAQALFELDRVNDAHEVLDTAIWDDGKLDFEDFFCYYDKLQYYLYQGKTEQLEDELDTVQGLPQTQDDREFAAFMLGRLGFDLYQANVFGLADRFMKTAKQLDPDNEGLQELGDLVSELESIESALNEIVGKSDIHDFVKHIMVVYYQNAIGEITQHEMESRVEEIVQALDNVMQVDPDNTEIKHSLRTIRSKYPAVFQLNEELFDAVITYPAADHYSGECPHCGSVINAHKQTNRGPGECPHCYQGIRFTGSSFKRATSRSTSYSSGTSRSSSSSSKTSSSSTSSSGGGGCFVATAVYGDYDHPSVVRLRAFRDVFLKPTVPGRAFIRLYYRYGPWWARRLKGRPKVKACVRAMLDRVVARMR